MARNAFDFIKSIIRDQTTRTPGLVSNLHGTVAETTVVGDSTFDQTWFALTTEAKSFLTLREFVDSYSYQRAPSVTISSREGSAVYPVQGSLPAGQAVLLLTRINVPGPTLVPVRVTANGYEYAIYADDQRTASGKGSGRHTISLGVGEHFLRVLCFGGTSAVQVDVPESFQLTAAEPLPAPPILQGNPAASYLSAGNGSYVVDVKWGNEASASEWAVYRAEGIESGEIVEVLAGSSAETLVFRVLGTLAYTDDEEFYTPLRYAGTITAMSPSTAVVDGATVVTTDITVQLDVGAPTDSASWLGQQFIRLDAFDPMGRVTYAGKPILTYRDSAVKPRKFYAYRITAFSLLTASSESDYSEPGWVYVSDLVPPGPITFAPEDLKLVNGSVILDYMTPADDDYQGVQVELQDSVDPTKFTLLTTEYGPVSGKDQLTFRPSIAGTYYFRTVDTAGNVQDPADAATWVWDGKQEWINTVHGLLLATVSSGTADLSLDVKGPTIHFPVQIRFFQDSLTTPMELSTGVTSYSLSAPGVVDSTTFASLGGIALPLSGSVQWWAEITDSDEYVVYAYSSADVGSKPQVTVVPEDYQSFPSLTLVFDEDVTKLEVEVPTTDSTGVLGSTFYTRGAGLPASGAGSVTYDVGDTATEVAIPVEGVRGPYRVYCHVNSARLLIWEGKLHGDSVKEPTVEARVVLDATLRNTVDVYVTPTSPVGEQLRIEFKTDTDPTVPLWQLVTANASSTLKYVDSGTELGPAQYFKKLNTATWAQELNNITLTNGQIKRIAVRAVGKDSGVAGSWLVVPLPLQEAPEMASVDLTFDKDTSTLLLTGVAGKFSASARFEISDTSDFSANVTVQNVDIAPGGKSTFTRVLASADLNKVWYGRVGSYTGALVTGVPSGLGGITIQDSELAAVSSAAATCSVTVSVSLPIVEPNHVLTITAVPATATVTATLNGADITASLSSLGGGQYQYTLTRSAFTNQQLLVLAEADGASDQTAYNLDRDPTPGFSNVATPIPLLTVSTQDGWQINGGADDDAKQIEIGVSGGVTLRSSTPVAVANVLDVTSTKTFSVLLNQAAGTKGTVTLTPKDGGVSGEPWSMELSLAPNTTITISEITSTIRRITLHTDPSSGVINASATKVVGGTGVKTYTTQAVNDTNAPSSRQGVGALTFFIDLKDAPNSDVLISYYAVVSSTVNGVQTSVTEAVKQQPIDTDKTPEVGIIVTGGANVLTVTATPDDDVNLWRLWARRLQSPIPSGAIDPDNRYLYFEGGQQDKTISWWAKEGDWYVIARAYDYAGRFTEVKLDPYTITVAPSTAASLSSPEVVRQDNATGTDYHSFTWAHNSVVTSTSGHLVRILENGSQVAEVGAYTDAAQVATPEQKTSAEANSVYRRYEYTVQLVDSGGGIVSSYPLVIDGYYDDGTVTATAPTAQPFIPQLSKIQRTVYASWNNSDEVDEITIDWWVNGASAAGGNLAPGVTTASQVFSSGDEVQARIRYYNEAGPGPWSLLSDSVFV